MNPRLSLLARDRSPPSLPSEKAHEYPADTKKIDKTDDLAFFGPTSPREEDDQDEEERSLRGSSEFMLVLYPDEDPSLRGTNSLTRGNVPTDLEPLESKTEID